MKKTLLTCYFSISIIITAFSQTTFAARQNIDTNTGDQPLLIVSGDIDGDTHIDIVISTYFQGNPPVTTQDYIKWYKNDGNGNFTLQPIVSSTILWVGGLLITDIDGDFDNDIVATSAAQDKLVYYENDGNGNFGSEQIIVSSLDGAGIVLTGDIDNDTNLDLIVSALDGNKVVWYDGDGAGNFGSEKTIDATAASGPGPISMTDFDGDGDLDIAIGYFNLGTIEIFYNQYVESGTSTVSWTKDNVTVDSGISYLISMAFTDVNDDGVIDIIKCDNTTGEVEWFNKIKNGASTPFPISDDTIIDRPGLAIVADLDNDTYNDVIVTDGGSNDDSIIWFESTNDGNFNTEALIDDNNFQNYGITVADFDNDGDKDIASVGYFSDTLDWYENELINLGLNDNTINKISIYPNPTTDKLYFKSSLTENFKVTVFDILGKKVIEDSVNTNKALDVSQLYSGIYILKFDDYNSNFKFVKQ